MDNETIKFVGLNGISQRAVSTRPADQVDDMQGFLPTPADGMRSAPTAAFSGKLDLANVPATAVTADMAYHLMYDDEGTEYHALFTGDADDPLFVFDADGADIGASLTTSDKLYLQIPSGSKAKDVFTVTALGTKLLIANKTKTINAAGSRDMTPYTLGVGSLVVTQYATTYDLQIGAAVQRVTLASAPTGLADAATKITAFINDVANTAWAAHTATANDDTVYITLAGDPADIRVFWKDKDKIRQVHTSVESYVDLPDADDGVIMEVRPTASIGKVVPYWVERREDEWVECVAPDTAEGYSDATMPLLFSITSQGPQVNVESIAWTNRSAGDVTSNPSPSFVGSHVEDLCVFQDRLGIVSPDGVDWSAIGKHFTFFRETAVETYDDDPILMTFGGEDKQTRCYEAQKFHDTVFVNTNVGKYIVQGTDNGFTPTSYTASRISKLGGTPVVPTTQVEDRIFFSTTHGDWLAFREYKYGDAQVDPEPTDITLDVPRFIPATCDKAHSFDSLRMLILSSTGSTDMYCFRYDLSIVDDKTPTQNAWFKLKAPDHVCVTRSDTALLFLTADGVLLTLDLAQDQAHNLTRYVAATYVETTEEGTVWSVPQAWKDHVASESEDVQAYCVSAAERLYAPHYDNTALEYTVPSDYELDETATVLLGVAAEVTVTLPRPIVRDKEGFGITTGITRVSSMEINTLDSGCIDVVVDVANRNPNQPLYTLTRTFGAEYELGIQALDAPRSLPRNDRVAINHKADGMRIVVSSRSVRPLTITAVAYNYRHISTKRIR